MLARLLVVAALTAIPLSLSADEVVRYRLKDWKAKHIHNTKNAETIAGTLKKLGCEVKRSGHEGHVDVRYRCPKWRQLDLDSHAQAHKWEKWLKEYQFETEHKH